jgi:nicotinic acid mononucleotide adenylyltransferase
VQILQLRFETWSRYEELGSLTNFLIAPRDHIQKELLQKKFPFEYQLIKGEELDISSTNIRSKLNDDIALDNIIPNSVLTYIEEKRIY